MQTTPDEYDELLDCRLAMLGLNLDATNSDAFNEIVRRYTSCIYREACAVDLKRDPNNPVWGVDIRVDSLIGSGSPCPGPSWSTCRPLARRRIGNGSL